MISLTSRRTTWLLAGWALWSATAAAADPACPPPAPEPTELQIAQAQAQARDRGFLWRITKSGRVTYLYGTLHVGKLEWSFPGPQVKAALHASDVLALEIDLSDPDVMAVAQQGMATAPHVKPLPAAMVDRFRAQMRAACLPQPMQQQLLDKLSPAFAMSTLVVLSARQDGLEARYSSDLMLSRMAHAARKKVISLEDPASQLALLSPGSGSSALETLEQGLQSLENNSAQRSMRRVARVWAESRFEELQRFSQWCECMDTPEQRKVMKKILDDRNLLMSERINQLHEDGHNLFVAVGSLHLVGPMGLPTLLERRGFQIKRIDESRALPCWLSMDPQTCTSAL